MAAGGREEIAAVQGGIFAIDDTQTHLQHRRTDIHSTQTHRQSRIEEYIHMHEQEK